MDEKWVFTHYLLLITHYSFFPVRTLRNAKGEHGGEDVKALLQWKQYITIHGEGTAMLCPTIACSDNRYNFDQMKSKIENQKGNSEYGSDQLEK